VTQLRQFAGPHHQPHLHIYRQFSRTSDVRRDGILGLLREYSHWSDNIASSRAAARSSVSSFYRSSYHVLRCGHICHCSFRDICTDAERIAGGIISCWRVGESLTRWFHSRITIAIKAVIRALVSFFALLAMILLNSYTHSASPCKHVLLCLTKTPLPTWANRR
jgi:hypothetical protein